MKKYLLALSLLALPHLVKAQGLNYVQDVALSSGSIQTVYISSFQATNVGVAVGISSGAYAIEVYNVSGASSTINCGYTSSVSTVTTGVGAYGPNYGREISPGSGMVWHVLEPLINVWCKSQTAGAGVPITVTQIR